MTGCCAKCKVPFSWCGNPDCRCHAVWLTRPRPQGPRAYGSASTLRRLVAEADALKDQRRGT